MGGLEGVGKGGLLMHATVNVPSKHLVPIRLKYRHGPIQKDPLGLD